MEHRNGAAGGAGELESLGTGGSAGIELTDVSKVYGRTVAVEGVDLRIEPEELFVLLGPSGCGKTTTLRMVAGLETPTSGTIEIGDRDVTQTLPRHRDISMVFQNYALYPHKTVRENLLFPLKKMDLSREEMETRLRNAATMLEIEELLEKTPGQLSGGQRQRVAVGRTVVRDPSVFLMDEPLSNLDARLRVQTRTELRQLQLELGTTTLYVTHDQEEAMSLATRIAIMNDGEIEQVGTPREVYERPTNEFVAGFLGEPPINFLDVHERDGEIESVGGVPLSIFGDRLPPSTRRVGIRPEDVYLVDADRGHGDAFAGAPSDPIAFTVDLIEPLGNAYEIAGRVGRTRMRIHVTDLADGVTEGSDVRVVVDLDAVHRFADDGVAIPRREER